MSTSMLILFLSLAIIGIVGSALYSGIETGLYTINRVRLTVRAGQGDGRASWLLGLVQKPARMLTVLLLGNNIANYVSSFGVAGMLEGAGISTIGAIVINAAILVPLLFIFGEVLPKDLFRTQTDRWSYACTGFLRTTARVLLCTGLLPVVVLFAKLADRGSSFTSARQRLGQLLKEGMGAGVLTEEQTTLLDRALAMRDVPVTGEMVPWMQVQSINPDLAGEVRLDAIRGRPYTRLPVVETNGTLVGELGVLDALLDPERPTLAIMKDPVTVIDTLTIPGAMEALRREGRSMAIVIDRHGRPRGLVTMKDLAEVLTGDLE